MKHAAQCEHCGPLLRKAAETLSDEATPNEEDMLARLRSARLEWQKNTAEKICSSIQDSHYDWTSWWRGFLSWPRPAIAVVGIAAVVSVCVIGLLMRHPPSVDHLLAQAYTEQRTLEVRIPEAKYAPMRLERGASSSNLDRPPSLLKAESLIGENLRNVPNDPEWLQARARADLLDGNYESAIRTLLRALQAQPDSPTMLTDLGSAYFERAESANRPIDYGNAAESLSKALTRSPDDPVSLFNHAVVCERMFLYTQAVEDWEHYLRVDPTGGWADEARKRLSALQAKLKQHEQSQADPLLTPAQIMASEMGGDVRETIEKRIEDYLQVAVTEWLPQAYQVGAKKVPAADLLTALRIVADVASQKHEDEWLHDVLVSQPDRVRPGIEALSESVRRNESADYGGAETAARAAEPDFANNGGAALLLRAHLEHLTAANRRFEGTVCAKIADSVDAGLAGHPYAWISAQLSLERANCSGASGNARSNRRQALAALRIAETHNYGYLRLRALGFVAESYADINPNRSFADDLEGLRYYWAGSTKPSRAYQFLAAMAILAEGRSQWRLATTLNQEAVVAIAAAKRPAIEAAARSWLGRAAYQAGDPQLALREWERSREIFRSIPTDQSVKTALAVLALDLAKVDLDRGQLSIAAVELNSAAPRFSEPGLHRLSIDYYATVGRLHEQEHDFNDAETAFYKAVVRTEQEGSFAKSVFERLRQANVCSVCYRSIVRLRIQAGDTMGALAAWERYRNFPIRSEKRNSSVPTAIALPPDTALYSLADLGDRIVAWLRTDNGTEFRELQVSRSELLRIAQRFAGECSDRTSSIAKLQSDGRKLHDWLVAPLMEYMGRERILIVESDPDLPSIPFEALVDASGHYLAESHAIAYTMGSAFLDRALPVPAKLFVADALILAAPALGANSTMPSFPLPESIREANDVAARFSRHTLLEGSQAKLSALERNLAGMSVFHYAGHASTTPGRTGLLLASEDPAQDAQSTIFTPEHADVSKLGALDLVVLSACSTSQLPEEDSSDFAGLSQDFLLAGSRVVLGNKWAADSGASELFMRLFYDGLLAGNSASIALSQAQSQLRARQGFEHPFFWCASSIWI